MAEMRPVLRQSRDTMWYEPFCRDLVTLLLTMTSVGRTFGVESRGGDGRWFRKDPPDKAFSGLHLLFFTPAGPVGPRSS